MKNLISIIIVAIALASCTSSVVKKENDNKKDRYIRFFNDNSFWNQPIDKNPEIDEKSDKWIKMLELEPTGEHFSTVFRKWTVPVYEADKNTKHVNVKYHKLTEQEKKEWLPKTLDHFTHGPNYNPVPIPEGAKPDLESDAHFAVVDWDRMLAWDMWGLKQLEDGSWESKTGMCYRLDGDGVFNGYELGYVDDESVHFHGPSRAAGVPVIAGLIRYDEVMSGEIKHKLSCATRFAAKQEFVYPASWTDGYVEGGIPEGTVIQLDPDLDLSQFNLTKEEVIIAKALQEYGMVIVDIAQGQPIYAEGLWNHPNKSWEGKLTEWQDDKGINSIPFEQYRILKVNNPVHKGDIRTSIISSFLDNWFPEPLRSKVQNILK